MTDLIWINGKIIPFAEATISVEDRGYQFADGVYEVIRLYDGEPFTLEEHLARLAKSAAGLKITIPLSPEDLETQIRELVAKTGTGEGMIYLQLTRGVAPRNHVIPHRPSPTLLFYCRPLPPVPAPGQADGVKLLSVPDERWKRCWIKSIALLPNTLAKTEAVSRGCDEAVFIDDGIVTECSASNIFAVIDGRLITHPVGPKVLPGITRQLLLQCARDMGVEVQERPLAEAEARKAQELFITSTTREISWAAQWDDDVVGQGRCGPMTLALHQELVRRIQMSAPISV